MSVEDAEKYCPVQAWSEVEQIEDGMRLDFRRMVDGITTNNKITVNTPAGKKISLYVTEGSASSITVSSEQQPGRKRSYQLIHEDGHMWHLRMEPYHVEVPGRHAAKTESGNSGK